MQGAWWLSDARSLWSGNNQRFRARDSPSSVMVPLLEPPLLLDCRWDEEEDTEDSAACPLGEGEGVRVGEVLLEVVEVPEAGLGLVSNFCRREQIHKPSGPRVERMRTASHSRGHRRHPTTGCPARTVESTSHAKWKQLWGHPVWEAAGPVPAATS